MRVIRLFLLVLCMHVSTRMVSQTITFSGKDVSLEKLLAVVKQQTGYDVAGNHKLIREARPVTVKAINEPLVSFLEKVLKGQGLAYFIEKKTIFLSGKDKSNTRKPDLQSGNDNNIPSVLIKLRVTDLQGNPLSGASVTNKNANTVGLTNAEGILSLNASIGDILEISYVGFEKQFFTVKDNSSALTIALKRNDNKLDEQVVIAYGTSTRRLLTGSVGKIKEEDISKQPVSNVLAAIQARVPGLIVTQQTGVPGGGFRVTIRGTNSLRNSSSDYNTGNNGNDPLYIIDGIPYFTRPQSMIQISSSAGIYPNGTGTNPLNSINPMDIESIEILKDADATSIYGSRGANGVIIITTKKGKTGTMRVDANFNTGIGEVTRKMKLLNTAQYLEMRAEGYKNDGVTTYPANAYDINGTWSKERYTDWQEELIGGTARSTDAQLGMSGGTAYTQYRIGAGYHKETTVFPGDFSFQRVSSSFSLNNSSTNQRFKSSFIINYSFNISDLFSQDLTNKALKLSPNAPVLFNSQEELNFENSTWENPLIYTKRPYNAKTYALISNADLSYELIKGLNIKLNAGYTNTLMKQIQKIPISSLDPDLIGAATNRTTFQNGTVSSWNIEPQLGYEKFFSSGHQLNLLIGTTFQRESSDALNQTASGFLSESLMNNLSAVPATNISSFYTNYIYSYNALFGRVNYNYMKKYIVTLSGRRDGSSRFGPGKQFADFGAIGAAWIFSDEEFVKKSVDLLSFGKLRSSYGITGSDQIPNYGFQDTYTTTGAGQYQNSVGLRPTQLVNTEYSWEETRKIEVALDLGFLNNQINFSVNYYNNKSTNQLVGYPLPSNTGFNTVQYNLPATVQNKGWEFEAGSTNINRGAFKWNTSFNLSIPENKLLSYPNLEGSSYASAYVIGEPLLIRRVYKYLGVDPETGLYQVEDYDKNGIFNILDRYINKFIGQKINGGLSNHFEYKNFHFDFLLQFAKQTALNYIFDFGAMPGERSNFPIEVMSRWKTTGDKSSIQKFSASRYYIDFSRVLLSEAALSDASFIRLKNVSISYSLPLKIIKRIGFNKARVYINGQNIFTITNYKGLDPETQGTVLPPLRVLTAGIQLTL